MIKTISWKGVTTWMEFPSREVPRMSLAFMIKAYSFQDCRGIRILSNIRNHFSCPAMSCAKAFLFFFNFIYLVSSAFYSNILVFEHHVHQPRLVFLAEFCTVHIVVSKTKHSKTTTDRSTRHPKLENEAPKTRNLPALYKTRDSPLLSHRANANTAGIKHDLTNRMRAVQNYLSRTARCCNAIPPP